MTPMDKEDPMPVEITLDIVRETDEKSNWFNRFCEKSYTHVVSFPRHLLTSLGDIILL